MDKKFWLILSGVVVVMIGLFMLSGGKADDSRATFEGDAREVQETDHIEGDPQAPVVLIEYGDFQCPGCGALFPALEQVKSEFGEDLAFVYRHFPLTSIHANAMAAHRSAEAAGKQGQFFAMHDLLFSRQQQWTEATDAPAVFEGYAQELGLDMEQYQADYASSEVFNTISRDQDSGNQLGVNSTPTLLLNGEQISTPRTADELRQLIEDELQASGEEEEDEETAQ